MFFNLFDLIIFWKITLDWADILHGSEHIHKLYCRCLMVHFMKISKQIWWSAFGYNTIHHSNIQALSFVASNFSIRYEIYHKLQHTIEDWCLFTYASKWIIPKIYLPVSIYALFGWKWDQSCVLTAQVF